MGKPLALTPDQETALLHDAANGQSVRNLAAKYGVSYTTVWRYLRRGDNPLYISHLRADLRAKVSKRLRKLTPAILDRMSAKIGTMPATDVDALARAALSLDKVSASVSGELAKGVMQGVKVEVLLPAWAAPQPTLPSANVVPISQVVEIAEYLDSTPPPTPKK